MSAQLQVEHGLTINEYEALLRLSHADDNRMRRIDLADGLQLTPSGVTRLLDGLERSGFVGKATCASDARVTYAVLKDAGRRKLEEAAPSHLGAVAMLFEERFTSEELSTLAELLERVSGPANAEECEPEPG